ncbi:MAG: tetratricopeptide repeat protein, partial [Desulfobacula sp.]|uniref:tetratricopeptide repeat protein n=1 Tax=Desulfobacula sp. TaxID=2593537 RepID=UPI0025B90C34
GNFDRAIADYTKALEINPGLHDTYYNRGIAWSEKGDLQRAIADCRKALSLDPGNEKYLSEISKLENKI